MSQPLRESQSIPYRGRYNGPIPTTNIVEDDVDLPVYEAFDDLSEATPRGPGDTLVVESIDTCQQINEPKHHTVAYDIPNLVCRRGQEFVIRVTFNREVTDLDDFQLEFLIGSDPSVNKGTFVVVTFGSRPGCLWTGRRVEVQGASLVLGVTAAPDAAVGKYRLYVAVVCHGGLQRTRRDTGTDIYLLFNAWCPEDAVFIADESLRSEYVLNDYGTIYQGSASSLVPRSWMYGQFEQGVLDACIQILDASRMPIYNRGNVIKLVRKGSAMLNTQDDNGVLVGNWSDEYSMGTAPTLWTGSVRILQQYANTGVSVCFAQCWVFAGVFNTFLRCLGIPARVITNFNSAHDNTGNLKIDLVFKPDGAPDTRNNRDSIWNYHCWNEAFMTRPDLPSGLGGWQVVDATPQETSDGHYRCGPASVIAIKEGLLCHPFDAGFVFAEVNSDVVCKKRDRYGTMTVFRVDTSYVGLAVYTKTVGRDMPDNITQTYKYIEGSAADKVTMDRAEQYGCERDHSELPETQLSVTMSAEEVFVGQDFILMMDFQNQGSVTKTVQAHLSGRVVFYTGCLASSFKEHSFSVTVPAGQTERVPLRITYQEYKPHLGSQLSLHFMLTGEADGQSLSAIKVVQLLTPALTLAVSGWSQVEQEMFVTVSFTNPLNHALENVQMAMEGPGLMSYRSREYSAIAPYATISWMESFFPRIEGARRLIAALDCYSLRQVWGITDVFIKAREVFREF